MSFVGPSVRRLIVMALALALAVACTSSGATHHRAWPTPTKTRHSVSSTPSPHHRHHGFVPPVRLPRGVRLVAKDRRGFERLVIGDDRGFALASGGLSPRAGRVPRIVSFDPRTGSGRPHAPFIGGRGLA